MRTVAILVGLGVSATAIYTAESYNFTPAQRSYWAFQPVAKTAPPKVSKKDWVKNPIDAFVLEKLTAEEIAPNPKADRLTLLRRATIDMTGLPPTQEEIQQYLNDKSADAWDKVVDRLLASPAYGERWGRHWLDVARYADSNGFKADETRPNMWRYRDYVIGAFNSDKPFDRFVKEQIAGDEIYPGNPEALVAMGFNRNWTDETNAAGLLTRRQETLDEMTNVTGQAFLGMTFGCARCHNHKFDPILQSDYYRLQAFFANTSFGDGPLPVGGDPAARAKWAAQKSEWEAKTKDIRDEMEQIVAPLRESKAVSGVKTFEQEVKDAVLMDPAKRDPWQQMLYHTALPRIGFDEIPDARTLRQLKGDAPKRFAELRAELAKFDSIKPAAQPEAQFMIDIGPKAPPTFILGGGSIERKGEEVQPGFLTILDPKDAVVKPLANSTGRRTALAEWLTDAKNPLVARVMVNRIWHFHFGRGIVATPGDFGRMGARPTHPELLDYLASSFVENGWSIKKLQKMILTSETYQQSSDFNASSAAKDGDDKLLWRWPRHRMEAEAVRDSMLYTSGLLNTKMGGPGVFPPVPPGTVSELSATAAAGGWKTEKDPAQSNRRSVYIFVRRNLRYPMLEEFDTANTFESHSARFNTVTPSQSLDLLNNELVVDWARVFAGRVLNDSGVSGEAQVDRAFRLAYGRAATAEEQRVAAEFLSKQVPIMDARLKGGKAPPLPDKIPDGMEPARAAAFVDLCQTLFGSNEFLYIN